MKKKIVIITLLSILGGISRGTYRRLLKEDQFPVPQVIGANHYFDMADVYQWLSKIAKRKVVEGDKLMSSKQLEEMFNKSSTWVWLAFQKNKKRKERAIYLRSRPYWLESEILADSELSKYLEVLEVA